MAKTTESKKRKASVPESGAVKIKKVKQVVEASSAPAPVAAKKRKAPETAIDVPEIKKSKKATKPAPVIEESTTEVVTSETPATKSTEASKPAKVTKKTAKITKKVVEDPEDKELAPTEENNVADDNDEESASEIDDQTEALLRGFESDGDDKVSDGEGLEEGASVPEVKLTKGQKKALKKAQEEANGDKPGVLFISRIPHGFFEHQMKEYFGQFGTILQLRLSRNKATGASKHYAFVQFESTTVAEIVAKTMDNYLLFNHILKVKVVADEAVPANVWKGAGKRFKNIPRNKMAGRKLKLPATEEIWDQRAENVQEKREGKAAKLREMGYEMPLPKIKSAKGLAKEHVEAPATIEASEPVEAIEDVPATTEPSKPKTRSKVAKNEPVSTETETLGEDAAKPAKAPKVKKTKETKVEEEIFQEPVAGAPAEEPVKSKKTKKTKVTKVETVEVIPEIAEEALEEESPKPKKKGKKAKAVEEAPVEEASEEKAEKVKKPRKSKKGASV